MLPFNADEAIVALMARHILQGERPVFFYGQAYMGSLDAWLVAAAFRLFGEQVWAIRLLQGLLYLGVLLTTARLGEKVFGRWQVGALAAWLLAIPAVNVTLYTTVSLGGYGEALLLGNLILLVGLGLGEQIQEGRGAGSLFWWAALGALSGLGLWAFGLALVYSFAVICFLGYLLWVRVRRRQAVGGLLPATGLALAGGLAGAAPWWGYAAQHGLGRLLGELSGGAIAGAEQAPYLLRAGQHLLSLALFGSTVAIGMRPPWAVSLLALPLLPLALAFWMAVAVYTLKRLKRLPPASSEWLLVVFLLLLAAGFVLTPFGADPSGRYLLPLAVPLALYAAKMIQWLRGKIGNWSWACAGLLLAFNLYGTLQCALAIPPGITTQFYAPSQVDHRYDAALIAFLEEHGETRGYSNYWASYPLAFLSQEELVFVPSLPYHLDFSYTERDDRYAPYRQAVQRSSRVAYITTRHPELDETLRRRLGERAVSWEEAVIGDYRVFYGLSQAVRPEEIGLGVTTP